MAIGNPPPARETDSFVSPQQKWYATKIENTHTQLRHLASSPAPNIIYHVNNRQVVMINTVTRSRAIVAELPFEPRCIATGHGYFVAGNEKGLLAYSHIPHSEYPLDYQRSVDYAAVAIHGATAFLRPCVYQIGTEIVNSITLHKVKASCERLSDEVVAMITNNDRRVKMFCLGSGKETLIGEFEQPMNHATISPDGQRLVIVGDDDVIRFYKRVDTDVKTADENEILQIIEDGWFRWIENKALRIPSGPQLDSLAFFTTAWNDSGSLCATASEGGYITVLDVNHVDDAEDSMDCIIAFVPSSRPQSAAGAVRSMTFAPAPWDFLIWAENNGRVCIADVRSQLVTRQTIKIDPNGKNVTQIPMVEKEGRNSSRFYLGSDFVYRPWNDAPPEQSGAPQTDLDEVQRSLYREAFHQNNQGTSGSVGNDPTGTIPYDSTQGLEQRERDIIQNLRTARSGESGRRPRNESFLDPSSDRQRPRHVPQQQTPTAVDPSAVDNADFPGLESTMALARQRFVEAARRDETLAHLSEPAISNSPHSLSRYVDINQMPSRRRANETYDPLRPGSRSSVTSARRNDDSLDHLNAAASRDSTLEAAQRNTESIESLYPDARNASLLAAQRMRRRLSAVLSHPSGNQGSDVQGQSIRRRGLGSNEMSQQASITSNTIRNMRNDPENVIDLQDYEEAESQERTASRLVNVNLPQHRGAESRSSRVPLPTTLPSLRDPTPLSNRITEIQAALPRPLDNLAGNDSEDWRIPRYNERGQIVGWSRTENRRDVGSRLPTSFREREHFLGLTNDEFTRLMRTTGTFRGGPLHLIDTQDAAYYRPAFAFPRTRAERDERGLGIEGIMVTPTVGWHPHSKQQRLNSCFRTVYVATDEGILELELSFETRKYRPAEAWA